MGDLNYSGRNWHAAVIEYMITTLKANIDYAESNKELFDQTIIDGFKTCTERLEQILVQVKASENKNEQ